MFGMLVGWGCHTFVCSAIIVCGGAYDQKVRLLQERCDRHWRRRPCSLSSSRKNGAPVARLKCFCWTAASSQRRLHSCVGQHTRFRQLRRIQNELEMSVCCRLLLQSMSQPAVLSVDIVAIRCIFGSPKSGAPTLAVIDLRIPFGICS